MSDTEKIEPYYQRQAKEFIDMMHDNKMINPIFSRDDMQALEDYIAYLLQSGAQSSAKAALIIDKLGNKVKGE